MPSKATLFNCNCDPIYDFGTGHRNVANFNPQGNNILSGILNFIHNCVGRGGGGGDNGQIGISQTFGGGGLESVAQKL